MNYKAIIEYDGTGLSGWQRQKEHISVQQLLEEAIFAFSQEEIQVQASGRTDAGVHARGQVINFRLEKKFSPFSIINGINFHLNKAAIAVIDIEEIDDEFNARFNAKKRYYRYHIINRTARLTIDRDRAWHVANELDINAMSKAAQYFIGNHDFTSFRASACQSKSPVKTIDNITITKEGDNIYIDIEALSFLHHMVRNIVGTLIKVGKGDWQAEYVEDILDAKDRRKAGATAPACGLYFMKVDY